MWAYTCSNVTYEFHSLRVTLESIEFHRGLRNASFSPRLHSNCLLPHDIVASEQPCSWESEMNEPCFLEFDPTVSTEQKEDMLRLNVHIV